MDPFPPDSCQPSVLGQPILLIKSSVLYVRHHFNHGGASEVTNDRYLQINIGPDHDFDIIVIIKSVLQKQGFVVFAFTDPYLALEHFKINANDYGLVISDVRMPGDEWL